MLTARRELEADRKAHVPKIPSFARKTVRAPKALKAGRRAGMSLSRMALPVKSLPAKLSEMAMAVAPQSHSECLHCTCGTAGQTIHYAPLSLRCDRVFDLPPGRRVVIMPTPYAGFAFCWMVEQPGVSTAFWPQYTPDSSIPTVDNSDYNNVTDMATAGIGLADFSGYTSGGYTVMDDMVGKINPDVAGRASDNVQTGIWQFSDGQLELQLAVPFNGMCVAGVAGAAEIPNILNKGRTTNLDGSARSLFASNVGVTITQDIHQIGFNAVGVDYAVDNTKVKSYVGPLNQALVLPIANPFRSQFWSKVKGFPADSTNTSYTASCIPTGNPTAALRQGQGWIVVHNTGSVNVSLTVTGVSHYSVVVDSSNPITRRIAAEVVDGVDRSHLKHIAQHGGVAASVPEATSVSVKKQLQHVIANTNGPMKAGAQALATTAPWSMDTLFESPEATVGSKTANPDTIIHAEKATTQSADWLDKAVTAAANAERAVETAKKVGGTLSKVKDAASSFWGWLTKAAPAAEAAVEEAAEVAAIL